ncbi:MAG: AbrB/MazE/SpoVT family DNA-binding domain-containing protein [Dehalococcoidia bacterium]
MKTTIDAAGRIVIPKKLRDQAGLRPGGDLDIRCRDGVIEIEPAYSDVRLEWRDGWLVAVSSDPSLVMTAEDFERIRLGILEERERTILGPL